MWNFREGEVLLFNKPTQMTSFGLVKFVRNRIQEPGQPKIKVGHAGTLDPLAEGLMIVCTGKATRRAMELTGQDKRYLATFQLGVSSPSDDLETQATTTVDAKPPTLGEIEATLGLFEGRQWQLPPAFSAKKIDGKRAFKTARKGEMPQLRQAEVEVYSMVLLEYQYPMLRLEIHCSKGTYIRSLARDMGKHLACGALMFGLQRTAIGDYRLHDALSLEAFRETIGRKATREPNDGMEAS